jgi:hypothetical protein
MKLTNDFIIRILKDGGYLASFNCYKSNNIGSGGRLTGTELQGLSLVSKHGTEWTINNRHIIEQVKEKIELREEHWEHNRTNSSGVEYYAAI